MAGSEVTLEYKVQIFTPPYLLNGNPRPVIESAPVNMSWHQDYDVIWSGTHTIDRVVVQKLADSTHSLSWDLRQVSHAPLSSVPSHIVIYFTADHLLGPTCSARSVGMSAIMKCGMTASWQALTAG